MDVLVYKKISFYNDSVDAFRLRDGTYQPPEGWRIVSMSITESDSHYAGIVHLLLEASVPRGEPYR